MIVIRRFWIQGPAVGKARARVERNRKTGRVHTRTPGNTKLYEASVRDAFLREYPAAIPTEEAVLLRVVEYRRRAKNHFRTRGGHVTNEVRPTAPRHPTGRPDLDNIVKSILDALNGIAWGDDSQVVRIDAAKEYSGPATPPGVMVEIALMEVSGTWKESGR